MSKQQTFAGLAWQNKGKKTRRERFLSEMDAIMPWRQLMELIEPHYPKAGNGRPPLGLEKMLRIYFLQIWFNLSDPGAEEAIYDSESMRRFTKIELSEDKVPDETSILNFRPSRPSTLGLNISRMVSVPTRPSRKAESLFATRSARSITTLRLA